MTTADRYLTTAIISSTSVVLFALLSIDMLGKIIAEIDILGDQNYTFVRLMQYVLGLIPLKLIQFFPMALLIGALMGLGRLAAANELTVMQIAGVSRLRLGILGFIVSASMGAVVLAITEFIGVPLNTSVDEMRAEALGEIRQQLGNDGVWAQDGNRFVHIGGVLPDGRFANVSIYSLDADLQFEHIIEAQAATFSQDNWLLDNVREKQLLPTHIASRDIAEMTWDNKLDSGVITLLLSDPEELSIRDLHRYIRYQQANDIQPTNYSLIFWQRLFVPLSTGVMFLLALPFVFGSQRNNSQGRKLFVGVMLGLAYYIAYSSIANIILLTGAPVILGALVPIVLFMAIGLGLLWLRG